MFNMLLNPDTLWNQIGSCAARKATSDAPVSADDSANAVAWFFGGLWSASCHLKGTSRKTTKLKHVSPKRIQVEIMCKKSPIGPEFL